MSLVQRTMRTAVPAAFVVIVCACTPAAAVPSEVSASIPATASLTTQPSVATPSAPPSPTPIAVLDGEPWVLSGWYLPGKRTKDLFLTRPDGTDSHAVLTDLPGERVAPAWAPDGQRFAFVTRDASTPYGSIWTADADGSGAAMLTDGGGDCPGGIFHPTWSPDGSRLAVVCYPDIDPGGGSIATFDPATGTVDRLYTVTWPEHLDGPPSWSPDGKSLAFAILHWDPTDQFLDGSLVAVVPAAGGPADRLTAFETNMSGPTWSPDGNELAMYSYDLGNMHTTDQASNVFAIRPDGTGLRQITRSAVDGHMRITTPRWSPDGAQLMVTVGVAPPSAGPLATVNDLRLGVVDAAGGEPVLWPPTIHGGVVRPTP